MLRISAKVATGLMREWTSRKHEERWQSVCEQRQDKGCLKKPSAKRAGELLNLSRNQLSILTGLLSGHCHFKRHPFKLMLVNSPQCAYVNRHLKWPHMLFVTVRLGHLAHHFMETGDSEGMCVSKLLHFVQCVGLLSEQAQG